MLTMTCSDDSAVAFMLRAVPLPAVTASDDRDPEDGWTPAVARIFGAIAEALDPFPAALTAVQSAIKRLRQGPS